MTRFWVSLMLYLIEILHQTTTCGKCEECLRRCILSKFYIKPQHGARRREASRRCILSKFYIKPQPMDDKECLRNVVSYRNSTSNHNSASLLVVRPNVVSYRNSTSNHNAGPEGYEELRLYLIEILHQTTTLRF